MSDEGCYIQISKDERGPGRSYRRLLSEKPPSKITVTDIAEGCGVTVPTFYNHFKDKYSLIVWTYINDSTKIMGKIGTDGYEWKDTLLDALRYFSATATSSSAHSPTSTARPSS